jgi:uncharacterized membrane protein YdjX (TVP38/TMEM64 family)
MGAPNQIPTDPKPPRRFFPKSNFRLDCLTTVEINGKKFLYLFALVLALLGLLVVLWYSFIGIFGEEGERMLKQWWTAFEVFVSANGFWLFCAITVLPAFILPVSPLLILAGKWGGVHGPWLACLYSVLALAVNLSWTYWFARKPGKSLVKWILSKTKYKLPEEQPENLPQWALILRLTPGVPFIFTNYILGLLEMPFRSYLLISLPILSITSCGYVLVFAGIFGGEKLEESAERWAYTIGGITLVIAMTLLGRLILGKKAHAN